LCSRHIRYPNRFTKTIWEISQKSLLNGPATRGAYVCQSQS